MLSQEEIDRYEQDGFVVVKQLLTPDQCEKLKAAAGELIDNWEPEKEYLWMLPNGATKERSSDQHLIDSCDKITFFMEDRAIDPHTGKLNREKHLGVSRIGHGLHLLHPLFKSVTFSDKIKGIAHDLKFVKPGVRQSLYIFKQPFIGGEVPPHQDKKFVHMEPFKVVGVWIALEDTTIENGCLCLIPEATQLRYIRNPNEQECSEGKLLITTGEKDHFDDNAFVPVQIKAGDAILFDGQTAHKSALNESPNSRQIFAIHIIEMNNSTYSKENWLQSAAPFPLLYGE